MTEAMIAYRACADPSLARLGLDGPWVDAYLGPDTLILADPNGHRVDIPFDAIDRARFGFDTSRVSGRIYEMRLWTHRARRPLFFLNPDHDTTPGYERFARGLAQAVAARRGIGAVEGGLGWGMAFFYGAAVLGLVGYGLGATFLSKWGREPRWILLILPLVVLAVVSPLAYGFIRIFCPRRLRSLDQLAPFIGTEKRPWLF